MTNFYCSMADSGRGCECQAQCVECFRFEYGKPPLDEAHIARQVFAAMQVGGPNYDEEGYLRNPDEEEEDEPDDENELQSERDAFLQMEADRDEDYKSQEREEMARLFPQED